VPLRGLAVQGGAVHGHTLYELWMIPNAAAPTNIVRYAGVDPSAEGNKYHFQDGPCAGARFPQISGVAAGAKGSIIVTDRLANAVMRVDAPGQPGCAVKILAGATPSATVTPSGLNKGDKDGPGAAAQLYAPTHPVVDEAGQIYVVDNLNKLKRIANDAASTVTTIAALPSDSAYNYSSMTYLKGKLYLTYLQGLKNTVLEVDPSSGKTRAVLEGNGKAYPPLDSSVVPGLAAVTTDGAVLYITGRSWLWSLTPAGALTLIAGNGRDEYGPRDELAAPRKASEFALSGNATNVDLTFLPGSGLWFRGRAGANNNSYIVQIDCPKRAN
jgi:hypothetical protein